MCLLVEGYFGSYAAYYTVRASVFKTEFIKLLYIDKKITKLVVARFSETKPI